MFEKDESEIIGPIRIDRAIMEKVRETADSEDRSYARQINYILKRWFENNNNQK